MRRKPEFRPDLALAVEAWGTIMGAVDKLTWLRRVDEYIAEGMAPDLLAQLAIRLATQRMNQRTGLAWVSPETLGNDIGKSRTSVTRALEAAVDAGLLEIVRQGRRGRGKRTTIYRLAMPKDKFTKTDGFDAVCRSARRVFGAKGDAVATRLLAAFGDDVEEALDVLACAEEESDPSQFIERYIEAAVRDQARRTGRQ